MINRRTARRVAALGALPLLLAGCANIPSETQPQVVQTGLATTPRPAISEPKRDADEITIVREFIQANGDPDTARLYLTDDARKHWPADTKTPEIIEDNFNTVPSISSDEKPRDNERIVRLSGKRVGQLHADQAFVGASPGGVTVDQDFKVLRQPDGQWRISSLPSNAVLTQSEFNSHYYKVNLTFFDKGLSTAVPDPRYVSAQPAKGLPARVLDVLLAGPSDALRDAVVSQIPREVRLASNVAEDGDGALVVDLTKFGDQPEQVRKMVAHQLVSSLAEVATGRIKLKADGQALVPGHLEWRTSELPADYDAPQARADLTGLMVADGRVRTLRDGEPVPGPAGSGGYQAQSAAQSLDGGQLALVERLPVGVRLRVGRYGEALSEVQWPARSLTRPTWRPVKAPTGDGGSEVWTVTDGSNVVRCGRNQDGSWTPYTVDAGEFSAFGEITDMRLSPDGVRVAMVVGQKLLVGTVVRNQASVALRAPRLLQAAVVGSVVGVDWLDQTSLVAATENTRLPVVSVPVDGLEYQAYNPANLTPKVSAIAAAPGHQVLVTDANGIWTTTGLGQVWRPHPRPFGPNARPFYPG